MSRITDGAVSLLNHCLQVLGIDVQVQDFLELTTPGRAAAYFVLILEQLFPEQAQLESASERNKSIVFAFDWLYIKFRLFVVWSNA
jgi:hypothetical protein